MAELSGELGQGHLFQGWASASAVDKRRLLSQLREIRDMYPGGLRAYVNHARELLEASRAGGNPFEGYGVETPVPSGGVAADAPITSVCCRRG